MKELQFDELSAVYVRVEMIVGINLNISGIISRYDNISNWGSKDARWSDESILIGSNTRTTFTAL